MPYVWGIGLVYFGLNDSMLMIAWCTMFVFFEWLAVNIKENMYVIAPLIDIIVYYLDGGGKQPKGEIPDMWLATVDHMIIEKGRI